MSKKSGKTKSYRKKHLRMFWKERFYPVWQEIKWPLVGVIWVCALVLGYIGFYEYSLAVGEHRTGRDRTDGRDGTRTLV